MNVKLFLKCRPTGWIRESNPRIKINGLAGQGHPPRDMTPGQSEGGESGRVGSGQKVLKSRGSGRVGSGQEIFKSHGPGRIGLTMVLNSCGPGRDESKGFENLAGRAGSSEHTSKISRFGSGQLTQSNPTRPDPTREV